MTMVRIILLLMAANFAASVSKAVETIPLWPSGAPEWTEPTEKEVDITQPGGRQVAGKDVIRLRNVSSPELHLYPAADSASTVIVCPGGGYNILAWDLEGTEVAQWLQNNGISAAVLKYRGPTSKEAQKWLAPVQDIQRAIALIRSGDVNSVNTETIGVLGFSAGGNACVHACTSTKRHYKTDSDLDPSSFRPDFGVLVYPAYLIDKKNADTGDPYQLPNDIVVTKDTPPMFFAHAFDDKHSPMGSVALFTKLKEQGTPSALHVFSVGGHGFGNRQSNDQTDLWMPLLKSWMADNGWARSSQ